MTSRSDDDKWVTIMPSSSRTPSVNFLLLTVMLPVAYPLALARDWWVLNGHKVREAAHAKVDKIAGKLYDLC